MIWSGLWERRWLSLIVLIVALVPVTAAALGPIYQGAAETAILRNTLTAAPTEGRGWFYQGGSDVPFANATFLSPPVKGAQLTGPSVAGAPRDTLMWQDGQCAHLTMLKGRCPNAAKEVAVAVSSGKPVGGKVSLPILLERAGSSRRATLKVVGIYRPTNVADPYWFNRQLFESNEARSAPMFTVPSTREQTYANLEEPQSTWQDFAVLTVDVHRLVGSDLPALRAVHDGTLALSRERGGTVSTGIGETIAAMVKQVDALSVPLILVITQLAALGWLLLFQTVADLVAARGPEIALARLRGQSRWQVWRFGLAEPLVVLAAALVAGVALAGVAAHMIAPPGVPVPTPVSAVFTGAAAVLGGVVAAGFLAYRMAVRPVTEEWRRTPRRSARGWMLDAIVLALAGAGLFELLATGAITESSGRYAAALAVPGLIALAVALLTARLLPLLARTLFRLTRRRGGLGAFLAIRQVARGAVTVGSVTVVATAVGVAAFAAATWTVTTANYREVAAVHTGADTVVDVVRTDVDEFRRAVQDADPSGRLAAPVIRMPGRLPMVAADPARLAGVGHWQPGLAAQTAKLGHEVAPRIWLTGERLRVRAKHAKVPKNWEVHIFALLRVPGMARGGRIPVGPGIGEWNLPAPCRKARCELRGFVGSFDYYGPSIEVANEDHSFDFTITELEVKRDGGWNPVEARLTDSQAWSGVGLMFQGGLTLVARAYEQGNARPMTYPDTVPVIANGHLDGTLKLPGLDENYTVGMQSVASGTAAPGLDRLGVVVDLDLADRAALAISPNATYEVWVAAGHGPDVVRALQVEGLQVLGVRHASELRSRFATEGPGAALALMLVSAVAAAVLALGRAVLALYSAARRRGYELAALEAAGARGRALRVALLLEQALTLGAGVVGGLLAGVLGARVALSRVPEFTVLPLSPPLVYEVSLTPVVVVGGGALVAGLVAASVLSEVLIRGITVDRLREAPT
ncbi:FtsX-like permease family protein [Nonomuraea sp. NPDC050556]|uniref:FtsX-like permease family protein n=1 Tax=Nonomuraea sp. NPDC050556 TaxID=3364369 RepID=UPI0037A1CB18